MHETAISLPVVLPEVVLAAGTLALVLYGALRGERGSNLVNEIAVGLLGLVLILMVAKNRPMGVTFYGSFADDAFTRFMSAITLVGSLVTLSAVGRVHASGANRRLRIPGPHPDFHPRHADADLGQ